MLAPADIIERVTDAVVPPWWHSSHGYDDLPSAPDGADRSHESYVAILSETRALAGRHRGAQHWQSTLLVRWLYRLRVEARVSDYVAALVAEASLIEAVLATGQDPELRIVLEQASRRELGAATGPHMLGELRFTIFHQFEV